MRSFGRFAVLRAGKRLVLIMPLIYKYTVYMCTFSTRDFFGFSLVKSHL